MKYTENDKSMLTTVDDIGMAIDSMPEENIIFAVLSPYLDHLMELLKNYRLMKCLNYFFNTRAL